MNLKGISKALKNINGKKKSSNPIINAIQQVKQNQQVNQNNPQILTPAQVTSQDIINERQAIQPPIENNTVSQAPIPQANKVAKTMSRDTSIGGRFSMLKNLMSRLKR